MKLYETDKQLSEVLIKSTDKSKVILCVQAGTSVRVLC